MKCVCTYPLIAMRAEASERSEMVSQVLFGEAYEILAKESKWAKIRTLNDNYDGWIDIKLAEPMSETDFAEWTATKRQVVATSIVEVREERTGRKFFIGLGAEIHGAKRADNIFFDRTFRIGNKTFGIGSEAFASEDAEEAPDAVSIAHEMYGAPYLWGGRSVMGIDCSGLTQACLKACGKDIARDASQQIKQGDTIENLSETRRGDLAFFGTNAQHISHVGLVMGPNADGAIGIIHASGSVRIDTLKEDGIWNADRNMTTHKLVGIRRLS